MLPSQGKHGRLPPQGTIVLLRILSNANTALSVGIIPVNDVRIFMSQISPPIKYKHNLDQWGRKGQKPSTDLTWL